MKKKIKKYLQIGNINDKIVINTGQVTTFLPARVLKRKRWNKKKVGKMKDIKNIKSNDILNLICKIYKRRKETSLLDTIPFLVSLANFCFVRGYLTESQKQSVFTIYSLYVTEKKYQKKKKTSDL